MDPTIPDRDFPADGHPGPPGDVKLRKCPVCKNLVGIDSECCPRCGANFHGRWLRRAIAWLCLLGGAAWLGWWKLSVVMSHVPHLHLHIHR
jgi:hypothetical protein